MTRPSFIRRLPRGRRIAAVGVGRKDPGARWAPSANRWFPREFSNPWAPRLTPGPASVDLRSQVPSGVDILGDEAEVGRFLSEVERAPFLAFDTETTGLDPHTDRVLLLQVGTAERQVLIDAERAGRAAAARIFSGDRLIVLHHAKFDLKMLRGMGFVVSEANVMDTMLCEQLLMNGRRHDLPQGGIGLAVLAERYAGMDLDKSVREGFLGARSLEALGPAELRYAQRDVEATFKVFERQLARLASDGLLRVAALEGAAASAFADMEWHGMPIDAEAWRALLATADDAKAAARQALDREFDRVLTRDLFGHTDINYESDQEVLAALAKLGLPIESTRREQLLASGHPAAAALVRYREHQKLVSTYGASFLEHVHPKTGRLHSSFKSIGAITGRSASSEPNLQNIPAGSEFRACFRAPPGRVLITADYSAAELRILAEMSRDPVFVQTFREGGDLHAIVASQVFRKPVSKTENPELRARAKAINFGLAYGMGAPGLAQQIGASTREAEDLLERYFRAFPAIRGHLEDAARRALDQGYAETLAGRKFWFSDMERKGADPGSKIRVAKNMPIQGTNADMTKLAMGRIHQALWAEGLDAFLVNMVHDELVLEASHEDAERAKALVVREMVRAGEAFIRAVPVEVEAKVADAWSK